MGRGACLVVSSRPLGQRQRRPDGRTCSCCRGTTTWWRLADRSWLRAATFATLPSWFLLQIKACRPMENPWVSMDPAMVNILATVRIVFFSVLVDRFGAGASTHTRTWRVVALRCSNSRQMASPALNGYSAFSQTDRRRTGSKGACSNPHCLLACLKVSRQVRPVLYSKNFGVPGSHRICHYRKFERPYLYHPIKCKKNWGLTNMESCAPSSFTLEPRMSKWITVGAFVI